MSIKKIPFLNYPQFNSLHTKMKESKVLSIQETDSIFIFILHILFFIKVGKILKGSLDPIQSPSPLVKVQIMGGKICLKCKCKTLLSVVNKLLKKSLLTAPSNVLPLYLKQTFSPIIWIFTEGEGDEMECRLSSKVFFTLLHFHFLYIFGRVNIVWMRVEKWASGKYQRAQHTRTSKAGGYSYNSYSF